MKTYPLFLIGLERQSCVVIGGASEALRKVRGLLECRAQVTVIAPEVHESIAALAGKGKLRWLAREYRAGDLAGAFLTISTVSDVRIREAAWREARDAGVLINTVDDTDRCNFIAGSVVRQGELTVSISTGGIAPALAVRIRQRLERELGPRYAAFLRRAARIRRRISRSIPDFEARRRYWYALVDETFEPVEPVAKQRQGSGTGTPAAATKRLSQEDQFEQTL